MLSARERNLLWGNSLWYLGEGMLGPLLAVYAEKVGGSILDITSAWAIFLAVTGVATVCVGYVSDIYAYRRAREWIMLIGYGLNALFTFAYLFVASPMHLFLVQAGLGFAHALASPTWSALYGDSIPKQRSAYAWGLQAGSGQLVLAVAIVAGGFLVAHYSFETLFIMMGAIQVVATIYQAKILRLTK